VHEFHSVPTLWITKLQVDATRFQTAVDREAFTCKCVLVVKRGGIHNDHLDTSRCTLFLLESAAFKFKLI